MIMKYNTLFKAAMMTMMMVANMTVANAQNRGGREMHVGREGIRMENRNDRHNDDFRMDGGHHDNRHMDVRHDDRHMAPRHDDRHYHAAPAPRPHFDRHGYLPGWEGRVRFHNGRYGYLRGRDWYWYDTYFEPDYYYAHPVAHFHHHRLSPEGRAIVGAVAGTVALATIISALAH